MWRMAFSSCTYREAAYAQLEGAFAEALADRSISAWVGANDLVALECLQYLQTRGVHMPHRISVLGFDDSFEAGYHSLTSYSFNAPAAMHAMVEYLLRPVSSRAKARMAGPVVVNGWVHERATTGVAGGHGTQQVDASDAP